jgi:hypothetical protein
MTLEKLKATYYLNPDGTHSYFEKLTVELIVKTTTCNPSYVGLYRAHLYWEGYWPACAVGKTPRQAITNAYKTVKDGPRFRNPKKR